MAKNTRSSSGVVTMPEDRNKVYVVNGSRMTKQARGSAAASRVASLRSMDSIERQKLVRMPQIGFITRRLPWEPA